MTGRMLRRSAAGIVLAVLALFASGSEPATACGVDTDCRLGHRYYRIALPEPMPAGPMIGAIVYMHGYRGTVDGVMSNRGLRDMANGLGVALIAAKSLFEGWALPNAPSQRVADPSQELDYFKALIDDVTGRFPIDRKRLLAAGFSAGGMMTWTLACEMGEAFFAFVPIAGTYWSPVPDRCADGPVNLVHYHGLTDSVVPLLGRRIAQAKQGEVPLALDAMVRMGAYTQVETRTEGTLVCEHRAEARGTVLEFCTHPGGHEMSPRFIARAWTMLAPR